MKTHIKFLEFRLMPLVLAGSFISVPAATAHAQISLGKMEMATKQDDETTQLMEDAMNRRVAMSPEHGILTAASKTVTIELHNPTMDTLTMDLILSDTVVGASRFVSREPKVAGQASRQRAQTTGKKLLANDANDSITSIFRPMSAWVHDLPTSISLAPGERKSVTVRVEVPKTPLSGEYATWVVGEVRPRKTVVQPKQVVYTISKVKLTYDAGQNTDTNRIPAKTP